MEGEYSIRIFMNCVAQIIVVFANDSLGQLYPRMNAPGWLSFHACF